MSEKTEVSMCDSCQLPGACCQSFVLEGLNQKYRRTQVAHNVVLEALHDKGLDFLIPLYFDKKVEDWLYHCALLDADGRCSEYGTRPEFCRSYVPGSDGICFHHMCSDET